MDQDQRDRPDWPESDSAREGDPSAAPESSEPSPWTADEQRAEAVEPVEPAEPVAPYEPAEPMASYEPAEPAAPAEPAEPALPAEPAEPAEFATPAEAFEPAWPTEPPAAGSGAADTWPTAAPEAVDEPSLTPEPPAIDQAPDHAPPPEVEAHAPPPGTDEAALAAAAAAGSAQAVPDAESATSESTKCPRCGTENRPGLTFCRNCGQRLVAAGAATTVERPSAAPEGSMACPRCGTHNRVGVAFCQNCGANLRGTSEGYVPPAMTAGDAEAATEAVPRRGAILGPVVLLIGIVGLVTGYLLPFLYGSRDSLFERGFGASGYGAAFWNGYPDVSGSLADQAYFGFAAPVPLLAALLLALAVAGVVRAAPGRLGVVGLLIALVWSVGLALLFVVVELVGGWSGDLVGMLRNLSPAGIIFFLSSLIVMIGTLTRFGRS